MMDPHESTDARTQAIRDSPISTAVRDYGPAATFRELDAVVRTHLVPVWLDELNRRWQQEIERQVAAEVAQVGKIVLVLPPEMLTSLQRLAEVVERLSIEIKKQEGVSRGLA